MDSERTTLYLCHSHVMRMFLFVGMYVLMQRMYEQRKKKIKPEKSVQKLKKQS